jgi:predicted nucleic acid-binding protein
MFWCVDTSAWIDAVRFYNPASPLFERLWSFLEQEILAGRVMSPKAVYDELREKTLGDSPAFAAFVKRIKGSMFAEETAELQTLFAVIANQYPDLTKKGKPFARSDADAWVIALAEIRGAAVVSQEKPKPSARVPYKIPDVARARGLTPAPLHDSLDSLQGLPTLSALGPSVAVPPPESTMLDPAPTEGEDAE